MKPFVLRMKSEHLIRPGGRYRVRWLFTQGEIFCPTGFNPELKDKAALFAIEIEADGAPLLRFPVTTDVFALVGNWKHCPTTINQNLTVTARNVEKRPRWFFLRWASWARWRQGRAFKAAFIGYTVEGDRAGMRTPQ